MLLSSTGGRGFLGKHTESSPTTLTNSQSFPEALLRAWSAGPLPVVAHTPVLADVNGYCATNEQDCKSRNSKITAGFFIRH
jgi:hypothetical protein